MKKGLVKIAKTSKLRWDTKFMFVFCFADGIYIQTTPPSEQEKREAKLIVLASSCLHFCFLIPCFLGSSKRKRKKTQGLVPSWWQWMLANFLASNIVIYIYIYFLILRVFFFFFLFHKWLSSLLMMRFQSWMLPL